MKPMFYYDMEEYCQACPLPLPAPLRAHTRNRRSL